MYPVPDLPHRRLVLEISPSAKWRYQKRLRALMCLTCSAVPSQGNWDTRRLTAVDWTSSPHISPRAAMIAQDFARVRVLGAFCQCQLKIAHFSGVRREVRPRSSVDVHCALRAGPCRFHFPGWGKADWVRFVRPDFAAVDGGDLFSCENAELMAVGNGWARRREEHRVGRCGARRTTFNRDALRVCHDQRVNSEDPSLSSAPPARARGASARSLSFPDYAWNLVFLPRFFAKLAADRSCSRRD